MNNYAIRTTCLLLLLLANQLRVPGIQQVRKFDVIIYGATSSGIAAAIQTSRMKKTVLLVEPGNRIGGLTTGGLGRTDMGNKNAFGGIAREFYHNIWKHYNQPENWSRETRDAYLGNQAMEVSSDNSAMWTFEPSAALKVYKDMLASEMLPWFTPNDWTGTVA